MNSKTIKIIVKIFTDLLPIIVMEELLGEHKEGEQAA